MGPDEQRAQQAAIVGRVEREPRPVAQVKRHLEHHYPKDVTPADLCRLTRPGVNLARSES